MPRKEETAAPASRALMVSREEADALMTVLLLTSIEDETFDGAVERILVRLAELQREFARESG